MRIFAVRIGKNATIAAVDEEGKLQRLLEFSLSSRVGDIVSGKVVSCKKNLNCSFLDIGGSLHGILSGTDYPAGQTLICRITRDEVGEKGTTLSTDVTIEGRYVVLTPKQKGVRFSKKFVSEEGKRIYRERYGRADVGFIIRSQAENVEIDRVEEEIEELKSVYEKAVSKASTIGVLYSPNKLLRELLNLAVSTDEILTNDESIVLRFPENSVWIPEDELLSDEEYLDVCRQILLTREKNVVLPCGAELVIEATEGMTTVDVNSKKCPFLPEYINNEAARELVRQIRIRNLGGLIVTDFISLPATEFEKTKRIMEESLPEGKIYGINELCILAISIKKSYNNK